MSRVNLDVRVKYWRTIMSRVNLDVRVKYWRTIMSRVNLDVRVKYWRTIMSRVNLDVRVKYWRNIMSRVNLDVRDSLLFFAKKIVSLKIQMMSGLWVTSISVEIWQKVGCIGLFNQSSLFITSIRCVLQYLAFLL
jgi:hypothetical protein